MSAGTPAAWKLAVWAAAALLSGCGTAVPDEPLAKRANAAVEAIGLAIPPGAGIAFADEMHGIDDAARLILVLPAAEWRRLDRRIAQAEPDAPPLSAEDRHLLGPDEGGWAPGRQPGLVAHQLRWRQGTEVLNVGVAPAGAGRVRVFLFWHQL